MISMNYYIRNKSIGSFTTRGRTASKITSTEGAISILALEGTSNLRTNRVVTLEILEQIEAFAGFIKNSNVRNAFQIIIDPKDFDKLREFSTRILEENERKFGVRSQRAVAQILLQIVLKLI